MRELVVEGIGICVTNSKPMIVLRPKSLDHSVRIFVSQSEADAIAMGLHKVRTPRPLTHDLTTKVLHELGGHLECVKLLGEEEKHILGRLVVRQKDRVVEIDCRPGDGIALALRARAPILGDEVLLARNALGPRRGYPAHPGLGAERPRVGEEELERLSVFREFIDTLDLDDLERA